MDELRTPHFDWIRIGKAFVKYVHLQLLNSTLHYTHSIHQWTLMEILSLAALKLLILPLTQISPAWHWCFSGTWSCTLDTYTLLIIVCAVPSWWLPVQPVISSKWWPLRWGVINHLEHFHALNTQYTHTTKNAKPISHTWLHWKMKVIILTSFLSLAVLWVVVRPTEVQTVITMLSIGCSQWWKFTQNDIHVRFSVINHSEHLQHCYNRILEAHLHWKR